MLADWKTTEVKIAVIKNIGKLFIARRPFAKNAFVEFRFWRIDVRPYLYKREKESIVTAAGFDFRCLGCEKWP
ncbi:MAG: hypothetical protein WD063_07580 [Pirellulales bacterium]